MQNKQPKISIIVPVYNQALYLGSALDCLKAQTYQNWECLIINDGSTDNSAAIARQFADEDKRFTLISQENAGLSAARNTGLNNISGDFVQFLDSDDLLEPAKFETQVSVLSESGKPAVSFTDYCTLHEPAQKTRKFFRISPKLSKSEPLLDLIANWENALSIPPHCFLVDARFFTEHNMRFDTKLKNHEDWDCWVNIMKLKPEIYFIDQPLAIYRVHPLSMMRSQSLLKEGFAQAIKKQMAEFGEGSREYRVLQNKLKHLDKYYGRTGKYRRFLKIIIRIFKDITYV